MAGYCVGLVGPALGSTIRLRSMWTRLEGADGGEIPMAAGVGGGGARWPCGGPYVPYDQLSLQGDGGYAVGSIRCSLAGSVGKNNRDPCRCIGSEGSRLTQCVHGKLASCEEGKDGVFSGPDL